MDKSSLVSKTAIITIELDGQEMVFVNGGPRASAQPRLLVLRPLRLADCAA